MPSSSTSNHPAEHSRPVQGVSRPTGVLPRNLHYLVVAGIAVLILASTFFSGQKARRGEPLKTPLSTTASQLDNFKDQLERKRREADEANQRLEELRRREQMPQAAPSHVSGSVREVDPLEQSRRAKAEAARFASSFAIRGTDERGDLADRSSQVALRVEEKSEAGAGEAPQSAPANAKESGRFMPAREGEYFRLFEGTTIETVLMNQLEGSFTGPVMCAVTKAVVSKDESATLIPVGSLFLGEATRVEAQNQTRLAVVFKRLILPNGYSIDLKAAPGLDGSGQTGLKDKVSNHRVRTFGISGAMGLLGGLALFAGRANPYAAGVGSSMGSSATNVLSHYLNAVPTITIRKGHSVMVYLPSDLLIPAYRP